MNDNLHKRIESRQYFVIMEGVVDMTEAAKKQQLHFLYRDHGKPCIVVSMAPCAKAPKFLSEGYFLLYKIIHQMLFRPNCSPLFHLCPA